MPRRLSLLDVGARGGVQWPWSMLGPELLSVTLVEPDPAEAKRLQRQKTESKEHVAVLPVALWQDDGVVPLHLNRSSGTSSIYEPNREFLVQFPEVERFDVLEKVEVPAKSIESLALSGEISGFDFTKIDVQGAELAILEGGVAHLARNLVGLEVEVEFTRLYADQPLFSDVDAFVREELGLELWDLRKTYWKYERGARVRGPTKGRLIFGDALYFRSLLGIEKWLGDMPVDDAREKVMMLVLSVLSYGYFDYAFAVLNAPQIAQYVNSGTKDEMLQVIKRYGAGFYPFLHGNRYLHFIFEALACAFKPTHKGWATIGTGLGSRRRGPFWL